MTCVLWHRSRKSLGQLLPTLLRIESDTWSFESVRSRAAETAEGLPEHCSWTLNSLSPEQVPRFACTVVTKVEMTYWDKTKTNGRRSLSHQILINSFLRLWKKLWKKPISFHFCVGKNILNNPTFWKLSEIMQNPSADRDVLSCHLQDHLQLVRKRGWEANC